ncbi:hypothetical protein FM113_13880 [Leucobacter sp. 7(1)]|nr:hypothetical protein FM113_13880 [Leucobacter sp. 7(1)]
MHTMLGTHETDPEMPIGFERLRRKITAALSARAVGQIAVLLLHHSNVDRPSWF